MLVSVDNFLPRIIPHVPGCPDISVTLALVEAAAEFCDRTHVWREDLSADTTIAGDAELTLSTPGEVASVLKLVVDTTEIARLDQRSVDPTDIAASGKPSGYWLIGDSTIRLYPIPDDEYVWYGLVALKPRLSSSSVEDFLLNSYGMYIIYGALSILMSIPGKDWTNMPLSEHYRRKFEHGMTNARVRDYRNVPLRVTPRGFN
jgi:hypothetical protein